MSLRGRGVASLVSFLFLGIFSLGAVSSSGTLAADPTPGSSDEMGASMVLIGQGSVSGVSGLGEHDFSFVKMATYNLSSEETRIYSQVPAGARDISFLSVENPTYGWETSGPMAGVFYSDIATRDLDVSAGNRTFAAIELPTGMMENVEFSSGSLHLATNQTTGTSCTPDVPVSNGFNVTSANLTLFGTNLTNASVMLSNDGGITWASLSASEDVHFATHGNVLKAKIGLQGNATSGPRITGFLLEWRYLSRIMTLHLAYVFTPVFVDGTASINLTEPGPFSESSQLMLMLELEQGYTARGRGVSLSVDTDNANVYVNFTEISGATSTMYVDIFEPRASFPWALVLGSGAVVAILLTGIVFVVRPRREDASESEAVPEERLFEPEGDDAGRRTELVARKKAILGEMDRIKSGDAPDPEKLKELKKEYKSVRNELNRPLQTEDEPKQLDLQGEYEATLAMIQRVDDDFERGRLPKESHEAIRRKYLSTAARLKERIDADSGASPASKKLKLMEAIVALEEARERGEIDQKIFDELNASYRKELETLVRRIDEGEDSE